MNAVVRTMRLWIDDVVVGWNRFWFTPAQPHTLAVTRILAGAMLFYTHFVWALDLMSFLGPDGWITIDVAKQINAQRDATTAWSYLWYVHSPTLLWILHILAMVVFAMLTIGLFSRVMAVLAWVITISYCHRLNGSWFGLDQINALLSMYLMLGHCGAVYSVDRWLKNRQASGSLAIPDPSIGTNIAIRLIQLHLCVIYLFGGLAKMRGISWWDGSAVWFAVANFEYQSLDMTWMVYFRPLVAMLSHVTIFWETFYCFLIWPKATRPIVLSLAVAIHGGIGLFLGMITFGLVMLIANLAFVPPHIFRAFVDRVVPSSDGAGQGSAAGTSNNLPREKSQKGRKRAST